MGSNFWAYFYIFSVCVFVTHMCLGWQKVTPVLGIPKLHIPKVEKIGYAIALTLGVIYISFPLYCMSTQPFAPRGELAASHRSHVSRSIENSRYRDPFVLRSFDPRPLILWPGR